MNKGIRHRTNLGSNQEADVAPTIETKHCQLQHIRQIYANDIQQSLLAIDDSNEAVSNALTRK